MIDLNDKSVLITGGTGTFGKAFVKRVLNDYRPSKLVIFSRDEMKQYEMQKEIPASRQVRYYIGDVRDPERLHRAFHGIDFVVHAAAMKIIPTGEYNPFEVVKTNILGAQNIIQAAIDQKVKKVLALSTDKAVNPINLYGATKLAAEKLFVAANVYTGDAKCWFSAIRYGNVINSRGSVIPLWREQQATGELTVTDPAMTRFFVTIEQVVEFALTALSEMLGGEIFVPKLPALRIVNLAEIVAPGCRHRFIGTRPGEKLHEILISEDEARHTIERGNHYLIAPEFLHNIVEEDYRSAPKLPTGFRYSSEPVENLLNSEEISKLLAQARV